MAPPYLPRFLVNSVLLTKAEAVLVRSTVEPRAASGSA